MQAILVWLRNIKNAESPASRRTLGAALMTTAMLIIPCADTIGKYLSSDLSPFFLSWARYAAGSVLVMPTYYLLGDKGRIVRRQLPIQTLRTVFHAGSVSLYYLAISRIPLADALGAYFIAPILATVLSVVLLRERLGKRQIAAVAAGFAGALLIAKPGISMNSGMAYALGAGCCMSCYIVSTRAAAQSSPPLPTLTFQYLLGSIILLSPALLNWSVPSFRFVSLILLMGCVSAGTHLLVIIAFRLAEASTLSPLVYFELIGTAALGVIVFNQFPSALTWTGIGLVVTGGLILINPKPNMERLPPGAT